MASMWTCFVVLHWAAGALADKVCSDIRCHLATSEQVKTQFTNSDASAVGGIPARVNSLVQQNKVLRSSTIESFRDNLKEEMEEGEKELPAPIGRRSPLRALLQSDRDQNQADTMEEIEKRLAKLEGGAKLSKIAPILQGSGQIVQKVARGEEVNPLDIVGHVGLPLLALANPLLGMAAAFVFTFFSGLFAKTPPDLYTKIMEEVKEIVKEQSIKDKMGDINNAIVDTMEELEWVPQMLDENNDTIQKQTSLSYFIQLQHELAVMKSNVFQKDCVQNDGAADEPQDCKDWQEAGTFIIGTTFATLHMTVLVEIMKIHPKYKTAILLRISRVGKQYLRLLRRSHAVYTTWRLAEIKSMTYSSVNQCKCKECLPPGGGPGLRLLEVNSSVDLGECCQASGGVDEFNDKKLLPRDHYPTMSGSCSSLTSSALTRVTTYKEGVKVDLEELGDGIEELTDFVAMAEGKMYVAVLGNVFTYANHAVLSGNRGADWKVGDRFVVREGDKSEVNLLGPKTVTSIDVKMQINQHGDQTWLYWSGSAASMTLKSKWIFKLQSVEI